MPCPCEMTKAMGSGAVFGTWSDSPVGQTVSDAGVMLAWNWPGLLIGTGAALLGYPKVAVGTLLANDAAILALGTALGYIDGGHGMSTRMIVTNLATIGAAATGLYFLGRYRDRKRKENR